MILLVLVHTWLPHMGGPVTMLDSFCSSPWLTFRHELCVCPVSGDPSGSVYDAVSAAMTTGIGQHLPGSAGLEGTPGAGGGAGSSNPSWRPRGVLASHLLEHRGAVNCLATSNNGALLLSGSDDETVKVRSHREHSC